jgi:hypothetical protein
MPDRFEPLEDGEVISVQHDTQVLSGHRTFRVGELNNAIKSQLESTIPDWSEEKNGWFNARGIDCEALRFGSNGWQKGRIRFCLEFCPDEPNPASHAATSSVATTVNHATPELIGHPLGSTTPPSSSATTADIHNDSVTQPTVSTPTPVPDPHHIPVAIPVAAGIAAIGTVAAVAAIATPDLQSVGNDGTIPHIEDTVLELEEHHLDLSAPHSGGLDEIAFDFDLNNSDLGIMSPNGMMELDLTDLGLDFSEQDLLSFEANGMSNASEELANLQDLGQPENSGMLIDEVWNEMNQGNWPGIN